MKLKIKLRNILSVKIHKIVLLLLALCIYNTAYGQNQRISVYGNNQSLQKVFEQIEEQTQLSITYNQTRLDVNRKLCRQGTVFCNGCSFEEYRFYLPL